MAEQPTRDEAKALYGELTVADLQADLGERKLPKTGNKDELIARLLDADFPPVGDQPSDAPADNPPPPEDEQDEDGDLCGVCWPHGWPTKHTNNASCEHGTWDR